MVDLLTGKPSGFGRFTSDFKIIDGQFYDGKMHGGIRKISYSKSTTGAYVDIVEVINYQNDIKNGKYLKYDEKD
jgi:hypothetical protein